MEKRGGVGPEEWEAECDGTKDAALWLLESRMEMHVNQML
jgi:hypothetical protein